MRRVSATSVIAVSLGIAIGAVFANDRTPAEKLMDRAEQNRKAAPRKFTEEEYERLVSELQNDVDMERPTKNFENDMKNFTPAREQPQFKFQSPRLDHYVPPAEGTQLANQEILAMR